jgi:hypothetical protein
MIWLHIFVYSSLFLYKFCDSYVFSQKKIQLIPPKYRNYQPLPLLPSRFDDAVEKVIYTVPEYLVDLISKRKHLRLSVNEVAMLTGNNFDTVRRDLMSIAALTNARLEVTNDGDILYSFPMNIDNVLRRKSINYKIRKSYETIAPYVSYTYRASFGVCLIASLVLVMIAMITASASISSSSSSSSSNDDNRKTDHHHSSTRINFHLLFDIGDFFRFYQYTSAGSNRGFIPTGQMSSNAFLPAIYSVLFGDGNPNATKQQTLYQLASQYIVSRQGVVTAEELALFTQDLSTYFPTSIRRSTTTNSNSNNNGNPDNTLAVGIDSLVESGVLPILLKFRGQPIVTEDGYILYHFPVRFNCI